MNDVTLYNLIENPSLLSEETLPALRELTMAYPCFQAPCILYLKNLAQLQDASFKDELRRLIHYIPDRRKLFLMIEGDLYGLAELYGETVEDEIRDTFSVIDEFLSGKPEPTMDDFYSSPEFTPSVSSDYVFWMDSNEGQPEEEEEAAENRMQHQDLIDTFIEKDESGHFNRRFNYREDAADDTDDSDDDIDSVVDDIDAVAEDAHSLDDSYFTETLARVYVKQRRYVKALQIIKNLSLKYPEKNIYFADQIRFLEKLIINTKK